MGKIAIVGIHSTADIMTNSSNEMFIGNCRKAKKKIEKMMSDIILGGCGDGLSVHRGPRSLLKLLRENEITDISFVLRRFIPRDVDIDEPPTLKTAWSCLPEDREMDPLDRWNVGIEESNRMWGEVERWFEENDALLREHIKQFVVVIMSDKLAFHVRDDVEDMLNAVSFYIG